MRRVAVMGMVVVLVALLSVSEALAHGAGGGNQLTSIISKSPIINATILLDPHMTNVPIGLNAEKYDVTTTAKLVFVSLQLTTNKGTKTARAVFRIDNPLFVLYRGCDPTLTLDRFVWKGDNGTGKLLNWVPPPVLGALMTKLFGATVPGTPVITQVLNGNGSGECFVDPNPVNQGTQFIIPDGGDGSTSIAGWLYMEAIVEFTP